jgi:hypothetical protein
MLKHTEFVIGHVYVHYEINDNMYYPRLMKFNKSDVYTYHEDGKEQSCNNYHFVDLSIGRTVMSLTDHHDNNCIFVYEDFDFEGINKIILARKRVELKKIITCEYACERIDKLNKPLIDDMFDHLIGYDYYKDLSKEIRLCLQKQKG